MQTMPRCSNVGFWSWVLDTAAVLLLALVVVLALGSRPAAAQEPPPPPPAPAPIEIAKPIKTFASWGNQQRRDDGKVFIYPLEDGTDINIYESTEVSGTIQINNFKLSKANAQRDVPIEFKPTAAPQNFFKIESSKPVNVEVVTPVYCCEQEAERFVASERQNFLGTKFVFHADPDGLNVGTDTSFPGTEEIVIINPGTTDSTVEIRKFDPVAQVYGPALRTPTVPAGGYVEYSVNKTSVANTDNTVTVGKTSERDMNSGRGHYKVTVTSGSPVLVWEGRGFANNTTIAAASDGSTIGSTIFASTPNDQFNAGDAIDPTGVVMRIIGVSAPGGTINYTIYSSSSPSADPLFTPIGGGTVAPGDVVSELDLPEDRLYKIVTGGPAEKIQVQYGPKSFPPHGAVMIGGNDGGITTNPGRSFRFFFEGHSQKAIDVLIPQAGTSVTITGPASANLTSTVNDQVLHFLPPPAGPCSPPPGTFCPPPAPGLYTVTASSPVWVVLTGEFDDQQGYFVYTGAPPVVISSSIGVPFLQYCHSAAHSGDADCVNDVSGLPTQGTFASETLPANNACAAGEPTTGTAKVRITAGDAVTVTWTDLNCGTNNASDSTPVNRGVVTSVGRDVQVTTEASDVRLRIVPRDTEYDIIDNRIKGVKRIVAESLHDGKILEKWAVNGGERLVVRLNNVPDVIRSATVKFWVGLTRFFGEKTIIARAYLGDAPVGEPVSRSLSAVSGTTFALPQIYNQGAFGINAFDRIEFSAAPGSYFGINSVDLITTRPASP